MSSEKSSEFQAIENITFAIGSEDAIIGTGFFFTTDGWALTPKHVVSDLPSREVPILYRSQKLQGVVKKIMPQHDLAILYFPTAEISGYVALSKNWRRNDRVVAAGHQRSEVFRGLVPLELRIEPNKPLHSIRFKGEASEENYLVLLPLEPSFTVLPGASGGPVLRKRTGHIIGMIIGAYKELIDHELIVELRELRSDVGDILERIKVPGDPGNFGFAFPFDDPSLDWSPLPFILDSGIVSFTSVIEKVVYNWSCGLEKSFTQSSRLEEIVVVATRFIQSIFDYYSVAIGEVDREEIIFHTVIDRNGQRLDKRKGRFEIDPQSSIGRAITRGQPLLVPEIHQEAGRHPLIELDEVIAELVVPIQANKRVIGFIQVTSEWNNWLGTEDLRFIETLANEIAMLIEEDTLPPLDEYPLINVPPASPQFMMGIYLVTNRQFKLFLDDPNNAYWRPNGGCRNDGLVDNQYLAHWQAGTYSENLADYPVVHVSWHAVQAYAAWLSERTGKQIRLPRQNEWELAVRAGRTSKTWWEDEIKKGRVNCGRTAGELTSVGEFERNDYGLYDLLGNVYELCSPEDAADENLEHRIMACGGAYNSLPEQLAVPLTPSLYTCREDMGFRCVCDCIEAK